jgi:hypothetical protein
MRNMSLNELIKLPRHLYLLHEAQDRLDAYIKLLEEHGFTSISYGKNLVVDINSHIEAELADSVETRE